MAGQVLHQGDGSYCLPPAILSWPQLDDVAAAVLSGSGPLSAVGDAHRSNANRPCFGGGGLSEHAELQVSVGHTCVE